MTDVSYRHGVAMRPLGLSAVTLVNCLGADTARAAVALQAMTGGLEPSDMAGARAPTWVGRVQGLETERLDGRLAPYDCRNNRLAHVAVRQAGFQDAVAAACARHSASRVGLFVGTSTSGIRETEMAYERAAAGPVGRVLPPGYRFHHTHDLFSLAAFCQEILGVEGPAFTVSTACSSSAKVFAAAHRYMSAGLCDAAVVGGVDSLCLTTLCGFNSLEQLSPEPCRPWDAVRSGISIGEGAGFALLEWARSGDGAVTLVGYGESSDAHHIAAPSPDGAGAGAAMERALARAGLAATDIDYVNLHGTGTRANDLAEDLAVCRVLGSEVPCSSTKGWTGHTLGAAGITEAIFCALALEHGIVWGTLNTRVVDPALHANLVLGTEAAPLRHALSNSFGFGGNNCCLIFRVAG
jgi:3-oxoacyl-[acyl-carrier-protein] synthase-1